MRPDSLLRFWRYINWYLLTYLLSNLCFPRCQGLSFNCVSLDPKCAEWHLICGTVEAGCSSLADDIRTDHDTKKCVVLGGIDYIAWARAILSKIQKFTRNIL